MKQLLFLLLFPCLALAQYTGNANQKITLGEQTTADGLVFRGRLADTANLLTNKLDTSVYIVLDTGTQAMWYYRASTTPKWTRLVDSLNNLQGTLSVAKGGTGSATQNFVDLTTTQSVGGAKTFTSTLNLTNADGLNINNTNGKIVGGGTTAGRFFFNNTDLTSYFLIYGSAHATNAHDIFYVTNTSNIFNFNNDGNFGVGISAPTEKLHVVGNGLFTGNLGIGSATPTTSGTGITFPAAQSASTSANTLDDYEEGTWTPIYQGLGGSIGSTAYSVQRGRYTRIGRFIHASGEITLTNKGSWSSGVVIEGLPYTTTAEEQAFGFIILGFVDFAADVKYCQFRGTGGANNRAYIDTIKDNLEREILFTTAINNNSTFEFSFIYTASN